LYRSPVNQRLVITVLGTDRPGLVETVSKAVAAHGGNWEASRMARLAGRFAGVLLVSAPAGEVEALATELRALGDHGLKVVVEAGDDSASDERIAMDLEVLGHDRPGIIREVSAALAARGVNIDELDTRCDSAPMAGHNLFRMRARVVVPAGMEPGALRTELEGLAGDLMVDIALVEPVEPS